MGLLQVKTVAGRSEARLYLNAKVNVNPAPLLALPSPSNFLNSGGDPHQKGSAE
jgi:hypothetical protein